MTWHQITNLQPFTAPGALLPKQKFRLDINALRGIAVAAVLLYHYRVPLSSGGFVGVDVFFVISGFLMTQIIARGLAAGEFSVWRFYLARARRIVPALAVLVATLLAAGLLLTDPVTYTGLAHNAISSLLFYSNFDYAAQSGYFAQGAEQNWLLHTWSLSVEWQFYLLYPVFLALAAKARPAGKWLGPALIALTVLSFAASIAAAYIGNATPLKYSFFILPTRAWELAGGGLLVLYPLQNIGDRTQKLVVVAGLAAIAVSIVIFDDAFRWPSYWAALPVLGTAVIIAAPRGVLRWMTIRPVQYLGTISYSVYLWHWPVVAALAYLFDGRYAVVTVPSGIVLSLALGSLSYHLVEVRLTRLLFGVPKRAFALCGAIAALLVAASAAERSDGFEAFCTRGLTATARLQLGDFRAAARDWVGIDQCPGHSVGPGGIGICHLGSTRGPQVLVIGDSHVEQVLARYLDPAHRPQHSGILFAYKHGCPAMEGLDRRMPGYNCAVSMRRAYDLARSGRFSRLVVISAWSTYFSPGKSRKHLALACVLTNHTCLDSFNPTAYGEAIDGAFATFTRTLRTIAAKNTAVTLVLPFPFSDEDDPAILYRHVFWEIPIDVTHTYSRAAFDRKTAYARERLNRAAALAGAQTIDPVAFLCGPHDCPIFKNGKALYKDAGHFRASSVVASRFAFLDAVILP